jgi:DNA-binding response OmpR family regulator
MPAIKPLSARRVSSERPRKTAVSAFSASHRALILSISPANEDHAALRRILGDQEWQVVTAGTNREAIGCLDRERFPIVVCEGDLPDGTWRDTLNYLQELPEQPLLIVTSRLADDHLWVEVLNLGAYDLVAKPFREQEVKHVLTNARARKAEPGGRGMLAALA